MTRRIFCKVLLVVVAIFGLLVLSGVLMAQGRSEEAFEHVRDVQERNIDRFMAMEGVEGTAIGYNQNERLAIKVFTAGPGVRGIPQELEGVPVQVVVTGKFYALPKPPWAGGPGGPNGEDEVDPTARFNRPVPIGVSTGHPNITAGTIGCRVIDGSNVYALSNKHVYAPDGAEIDDYVLQPGALDGGKAPDDAIGTLFASVPIVFLTGAEPEPTNTIDAAIALSSGAELGNATPSDGYGTPKSSTVLAQVRQKVQKYGRTTGLTNGRISEVNATVDVEYGGGNVARFVNQIVISPGNFSAGGDSGSLIVTQKGKNPVGLLFAGSFFRTIANPINDVLTQLGVTIDGE